PARQVQGPEPSRYVEIRRVGQSRRPGRVGIDSSAVDPIEIGAPPRRGGAARDHLEWYPQTRGPAPAPARHSRPEAAAAPGRIDAHRASFEARRFDAPGPDRSQRIHFELVVKSGRFRGREEDLEDVLRPERRVVAVERGDDAVVVAVETDEKRISPKADA